MCRDHRAAVTVLIFSFQAEMRACRHLYTCLQAPVEILIADTEQSEVEKLTASGPTVQRWERSSDTFPLFFFRWW